ncbi:uncharacterized protein [Aristolochia californica]|uniref:uncharacterized protein n=1 Tax=Aristolochia californica TaxID=171875 RepID=UPI0035D8A1F7
MSIKLKPPSLSSQYSYLPSLSPPSITFLFSGFSISSHPFPKFHAVSSTSFSLIPSAIQKLSNPRVASVSDCFTDPDSETQISDLAPDGDVYQKTLRLVECAMFAAVTGLTYFLSNSLAIENYFGCFFAFPIVISSLRWGLAAGRKTMVATAMLLLTLSGPVKASTYLLMHGVVGLAMGSLWRLQTSWSISIVLCTVVRAMGAVGYVLLSSFLIRENILAIITINIHASLSYVLAALGINTIPSMNAIYAIFGSLLLLNCGFFIFLLHILYAVFLTRLGMKTSLALPRWLEKALG